MKKTVLKLISISMCLLFALGVFAACGEKEEVTYVIGLSGPFTGDAQVYGQAVKNAAQMAVDEINEAGGLDGVKFSLVALNDEHDPQKVSANYAEMMDKGMHVSLGCVTTNPCLEFATLSEEENVFFLTPSASANAVVNGSNAYQMCFADGNQGEVAAEYVNGLGLTEIGIYYKSDDAYSKGIYDQFKDTLSKDIKTVEASFTGKTDTTLDTHVDALKDCKFIFMPIYYTPASAFMVAAKDKVASDATYYGCDGFDGIESNFDVTTVPQKISMLSHFNSKATEGAAGDFVTKYTNKYGKETLNQFGASAYDCVYAIYNAMKTAKAAGKDINPDMTASDLCHILKEQFNGEFTYSGVTGENIKWNATGYVQKEAIAFVIKEAD